MVNRKERKALRALRMEISGSFFPQSCFSKQSPAETKPGKLPQLHDDWKGQPWRPSPCAHHSHSETCTGSCGINIHGASHQERLFSSQSVQGGLGQNAPSQVSLLLGEFSRFFLLMILRWNSCPFFCVMPHTSTAFLFLLVRLMMHFLFSVYTYVCKGEKDRMILRDRKPYGKGH